MRRSISKIVIVGCLATIAGCASVAGTWETVSVDPPGVPFALQTLTMDDKNNYTASWSEDGLLRTTTGTYRWNGRSLQMGRFGHNPKKYKARRTLDGKLVIYFEHNDNTLTTVMAKSESPK